ncbi:hypothetical protein UPYG_G00203700 [Umbra pygmaea]|uniref:Immunoglobulin domain-containing protein n=1 Tax=Umbra pygmaea TaxID=75934 RepID=A0ABD0WIT7_UMBPY
MFQRHMHQACLALLLGWMVLLESKDLSDTTPLVGPVGGEVTFQCLFDLGSSLEWFYIQRRYNFINGYHIKGIDPKEYTNRTEVNRTQGSVRMWDLQLSDKGMYECKMKYIGKDDILEMKINLTIIANNRVPNVTVTCVSSLCWVTCSYLGDYPHKEVQWSTFPHQNESQWKVNSSDEMDTAYQMYSLVSTVKINCSSMMKFNLSCGVGGAVSEQHTVCVALPDPTTHPLIVVSLVVVLFVICVICIAAFMIKKYRSLRHTNDMEKEEMPEREQLT